RLRLFRRVAHATVIAGRIGLMRAVAPWAGDSIGLDGAAHAEKIYFFAHAPTLEVAAAEMDQAQRAAEQALAAGELDPELPVGAITEGRRSWGAEDLRLEGARRSHHGWSVNVPDANHASLLGRDHARVIADGVERLLAEAEPRRLPPA